MRFAYSAALILLIVIAASASDDLHPCEPAIGLDSLDLSLRARLAEQLGFDRPIAQLGGVPIVRIIVEPDYACGRTDYGAEWAVAIYLPETGPAIVEAAIAAGSIRGANSKMIRVAGSKPTYRSVLRKRNKRISVGFPKTLIQREIAIAIQGYLFANISEASIESEDPTIRIHPTKYSFLVWMHGLGRKCAEFTLHDEELIDHHLGQLILELRKLTEGERSGPAAIDKLKSLVE